MTENVTIKVRKSNRGAAPGERRGGRVKGTPNKISADVRVLAQKYGPAAMAELGRLSVEAESESSRVSAIREILDRAYGKAPQPMEHAGKDGGAIQHQDVTNEDRARALLSLLASVKGKSE